MFPAKEDKTSVRVRQKKSRVVYQLDESQHAQVNVTKEDYISIETDKPVFVQQYVVTHVTQGDDDCDGNGCGSFLLTVPPMQQRKQQYYVVFNTANSATGKHNVNLIVATSLRNGLLINGTDLSNYINSSNIILHPPSAAGAAPPTWNIIDQNQNSTNNNQNISLSSIQFPVDEGLHRISHNSSSNALFTVTSVPHLNDAQKDISKWKTVSLAAAAKENNNIVPTAQVEKTNTRNEINNAVLSGAQSRTQNKQLPADIPHSLMAVIISVIVAVVFVIICIVGFVFVEFAFHNGERSLFKSSRVGPYEEIKDWFEFSLN